MEVCPGFLASICLPLTNVDPGFHYHAAVAKLWAVFTAKLAEAPVIPLNATDYAIAIDGYISQVESKLESLVTGQSTEEEDLEARERPTPQAPKGDADKLKLSFGGLHKAARKLKEAAQAHGQSPFFYLSFPFPIFSSWKYTSALLGKIPTNLLQIHGQQSSPKKPALIYHGGSGSPRSSSSSTSDA